MGLALLRLVVRKKSMNFQWKKGIRGRRARSSFTLPHWEMKLLRARTKRSLCCLISVKSVLIFPVDE